MSRDTQRTAMEQRREDREDDDIEDENDGPNSR